MTALVKLSRRYLTHSANQLLQNCMYLSRHDLATGERGFEHNAVVLQIMNIGFMIGELKRLFDDLRAGKPVRC